jgi:hypothetical protein
MTWRPSALSDMPLIASTEPLLRALPKPLRMPSQCDFRVRASFLKGASLLRRAHRNQACICTFATVFVLAVAKISRSASFKRKARPDLDALSETSTETILEKTGVDADGKPVFSQVRKTKIKLHDKLAALEKLARYTGVFDKET